VSKPGKPSGLCSAGLLDVCTAVYCCVLLCTGVYCSEGVASGSCSVGLLDVCTAQRMWPVGCVALGC
jgi:hypothetical protein